MPKVKEGKENIMLDIDTCTAFVQQALTPNRFDHSLRVMQVMSELAPIYDLDEITALVCGILHDVAKELPIDYQLKLAVKNNISLITEYDKNPLFLHGPVGACHIAQELGIKDPVILDTILRHSYFGDGIALSPSFCWCLRFADVLEPMHDWDDLTSQLKPLVYSGKIQEGAYQLMKWMIPFLESEKIPVHPNMRKVFKKLSVWATEGRACDINALPV